MLFGLVKMIGPDEIDLGGHPNMWLIHRDTDGNSRDRIPLPAPLHEALVRWYVGDGSSHDEQAGVTLVQNARITIRIPAISPSHQTVLVAGRGTL